jgi:hypothetical protein
MPPSRKFVLPPTLHNLSSGPEDAKCPVNRSMRFELPTASVMPDRPRRPVEVDVRRSDRRERARTAVRWPVLLFRDRTNEVVETVTENLNCAGFFCFSETPLSCDERLNCVLRVPAVDVHAATPALTLFCTVRVLRVEKSSVDTSMGIACRIESYGCDSTEALSSRRSWQMETF